MLTKEELAEKVKMARQRYEKLCVVNVAGKSELERIELSIDMDTAWREWRDLEEQLRARIIAERAIEPQP